MERLKRPLAILCLILMGILIVGAVVLALIGTERSARLLMADLFCLIVIPVAFYGYQMLMNVMKKKNPEEEKKD
mgnify:CR=1 FL=1